MINHTICLKQEKMEDKKITERESLELISQMIQQTKQGASVGAGKPLIVWGIIMMIVAAVVGLCIQLTGQGKWMWGYFAIPLLGFLYNYITKKRVGKTETPQMKTYIEENIQLVWKGIGIVLLAYPLIVFVLRADEPKAWIGMYFLGVFMPTIGSYMTGLMLKSPKLIYYNGLPLGMCLFMLADLFTNNVMTNKYNFVFAMIAFFSLVVPGIIINREGKISKKNNA